MKLGVRISLAGLLAAALTAGSCLFPAASGPVSPWLLNVSRAPTEKKASVSEEQFPSVLYGTWSGVLPTFVSSEKYVEDPVTLSIPEESENRQPALKVGSYGGSYLLPNSWSVSKGTLRFTLYDSAWQMAVELQAVSEIELTGVVRQYGEEMTVTLYKLSDTAEDLTASPRFIFENEEASVWQERLSAYPSFSESSSGTPIPFTYELWRWDRSNQLLSRYPALSQAVKENSLQTMKAVMDVVCDHFMHDGASGMPESTDIPSILSYYDATGRIGLECRGLSLLLSEMLRLCGIPAKPVTCLPENDPCEECHVLVHAYSPELGRWVLLDPSYRLMLQDGSGQYIGLSELRQALISGEELFANADAGHNGMPFTIDWYRAYMTKNTFRFSSAVHFSALSQENGEGVERWMLIPEGFSLPYWAQRPEKITTSAADFWAAP